MDENIQLIEKTILALINKDFNSAENFLLEIDSNKLFGERKKALSEIYKKARKYIKPFGKFPRSPVKSNDEINTFKRDKFICRYKHCKRYTIHPLVLREISRIFPEIFPYHLHWKFEKTHILYWIYASSIEHTLSFPHGGNSDAKNLITACYLCNDIKKHYPVDLLEWEVTIPSDADWDGFMKYLPQLKKIKNTFLDEAETEVKRRNISKIIHPNIDLKSLSAGTIAKNVTTNNSYVILEKTQDGIIYFSRDENMILKIKTKVLLVRIEFKPSKNYTSIKEASNEKYNIEQLKVIDQALKIWK